MKILAIQLREASLVKREINEFLMKIRCFNPSVTNNLGDDIVNITIKSEGLYDLFEFLKKKSSDILKNRWIVVCEGDHGWSDYLLLAHYDSSQKVDALHKIVK